MSITIEETFETFLSEQKARLATKTWRSYEDIVQLLTHSLNGYAYLGLDEADAERFDKAFNAKGDEHREFCQLFGPEHIAPNIGEFLGYFFPRKVMASAEQTKQAGTVTRKLAVARRARSSRSRRGQGAARGDR